MVFLTWILVKLHDCNMRLIVCLWRPFHKCFVRIRKRWDSKTDLVDVFITFLILSCYKIIFLTGALIDKGYITKYDKFGNLSTITVASIDQRLLFLSSNHLPYLLISLLFSFIFTFLPPLLLILYPIIIFRSCLSKCCLKTINIFTDKIQNCYRNGLDGGRDMRSFSAFYFYLRLLVHIHSIVFHNILKLLNEYTTVGVTFFLSALIVALIKPYRKTYMNILDTLLLINISLLCFSQFQNLETVFLLLTAPIFAITLLFLLRKFNQNQLLLKLSKRDKSKVCCHYLCRLRTRPITESSQNPDSATNILNYQPLPHIQPLIQVMTNEITIKYGTIK